MSDNLTIKDFGIDALVEDLKRLGTTKIALGWQGETGAAQHDDAPLGTDVASIAAVHEYGSSTVPERPSLRTLFEMRKQELNDAVALGMSDLIDGRNDLQGMLKTLGEEGLESLHAQIDQARTWATPLAAATVQAKGHDDPLVDTFQMRNAASYRVYVSGNPQGPEITGRKRFT